MKLLERIKIVIIAAIISFLAFNLMVTPRALKLMKVDQLSGHEIVVTAFSDKDSVR